MIFIKIDNNDFVCGVFIDLEKAFDTVTDTCFKQACAAMVRRI